MNKDDKLHFLKSGGTFIRKGVNRDGKPIVKAKTESKDWHTVMQSNSIKERNSYYSGLLRNNPNVKED